DRYDVIVPEVLPALQKMKDKGKIRFIGITEVFNGDRGHAMLERAVADDLWDVIMIGFNILNTCARERVLHRAKERNVGVFDMFAVRRALRDIAALDEHIRRHVAEGKLDDRALGLIELVRGSIDAGECRTLPELAYRYCLHEPRIDCVLTGTGSVEHLRENLRAAEMPPPSEGFRSRLDAITGEWDHLSAQ
ncbi:MAG: aldo/keto reductase, partial [Planctomycetota bacterium]